MINDTHNAPMNPLPSDILSMFPVPEVSKDKTIKIFEWKGITME